MSPDLDHVEKALEGIAVIGGLLALLWRGVRWIYLAVSPSAAINRRIESVERALQELIQKVQKVAERIEKIDDKADQRIEHIEERLNNLDDRINSLPML